MIPVIDLKSGQVVHARGGRRETYRAIETRLSATSAPADVGAGLLRLSPFRSLYIADIDAIEGRAGNAAALDTLPGGLDLWLDAGIATEEAAREWLGPGRSLVLGSESQADTSLLRAVRDDPRIVLSLDFRGDAFQGPPAILTEPALWPGRVIVMTLARVGAGQGPDLARVASIMARAGRRRVYAAGGVRNAHDLGALAACGAAGALVGTALHSGAIGAAEIAAAARF